MENPNRGHTNKLGRGFFLVAWLIIFGLLYLFFSDWLDAQIHPNRELTSGLNDQGARHISLEPNRHHAYVAPGTINGHPVIFMVDTGASSVAIPEHLMQRLGIKAGARIQLSTAGGIVPGYLARIDHLTIGPIELNNVRATIAPGMREDWVLLGMSALKSLTFHQEGGKLIITQH